MKSKIKFDLTCFIINLFLPGIGNILSAKKHGKIQFTIFLIGIISCIIATIILFAIDARLVSISISLLILITLSTWIWSIKTSLEKK